MTMSKRTRFEVLKRDSYTCRYCRTTDNALTVDHVVPVALGGGDEPSNLVAACRDCNAGKSSTSPDGSLIDDVAEDAIRWARAMKRSAEMVMAEEGERRRREKDFVKQWRHWDEDLANLPTDFTTTVAYWHKVGVPELLTLEAVDIAWCNFNVSPQGTFRYTCGIVRKYVERIQAEALEYLKDANGGGL